MAGYIQISTRYVLRDDNTGQFLAMLDNSARMLAINLVNRLAEFAQGQAPVWTGELRGSIQPVMYSSRQGAAIATAGHSVVVHEGASPHAIPNAFGRGPDFGNWPGFHPGHGGNPYMTRAYYELKAIARAEAEAAYPY